MTPRLTLPVAVLTALTIAAPLAGPSAASVPSSTSTPALSQPTPTRSGYLLPGDRTYPEGIATDPRTGDVYAGSLTSGTIYRAHPGETKLRPWLRGEKTGHTSSFGMKIDRKGRLLVIGGLTRPDRVNVYDVATSRLLARFTVTGPVLLNDLTLTPGGDVYVTDSLQPRIFRIPAESLPRAASVSGSPVTESLVPVWLQVPGVPGSALPPFPDFDGFNGIASTANGRYLLVAANSGDIWVVRTDARDSKRLEIGPAVFADGLLVHGHTLYAVDAFTNRVEVLALPDLRGPAPVARRLPPLTDPTLNGPSTAALQGRNLLVSANFQGPSYFFPQTAPNGPDLPFRITRLPLAASTTHKSLP